MKKRFTPFAMFSVLTLGLLILPAPLAEAGCGACPGDKAGSGETAAKAEGHSHAACEACKEGKTCPSCAEKKAAKSSSCPACKEGKTCSACCAAKTEAKAAKGGEGQRFFGNATCPVMGGKTNPKQFAEYKNPKTHTYAKIHVCCPGCLSKVKKDPATAYKKAYLDRELKCKEGKVIAKKGQPHDLKNEKCPVMGAKVSPKTHLVYNGYKVGLCCAGCEKQFMKSPDKHLTKLMPKKAAAKADHGG